MAEMNTQDILAAIEEAITEGGNIIIRFAWGRMRTLNPKEADLLLAVLKANSSDISAREQASPDIEKPNAN